MWTLQLVQISYYLGAELLHEVLSKGLYLLLNYLLFLFAMVDNGFLSRLLLLLMHALSNLILELGNFPNFTVEFHQHRLQRVPSACARSLRRCWCLHHNLLSFSVSIVKLMFQSNKIKTHLPTVTKLEGCFRNLRKLKIKQN